MEEQNNIVPANDSSIEFPTVNYNTSTIPQNSTAEMIEKMHQAAILKQVQTDEETNKKFMDQAKKTVENQLDTIDKENVAHRQQATYSANREACRCYGIEEAVPLWQIRMMRFGHSIWFIIYWLFATVTICPINVFVTGINAFIKRTWLSIIIAILIYLIFAVALPILLNLKKGAGV